ncbi:MAG: hypothetical protein Q4B03_00530 [Lachnospiraceae bacterium]|nr:hypothetical protein [Lachnospiraceae bacterium]
MFTQEYIEHLIHLQALDLEAGGIDYLAEDTDRQETFLFSLYGLEMPLVRKIVEKDEEYEAFAARVKENEVDPDAENCLMDQLPLMEAYAAKHPDSTDPVFCALYAGYISMQENPDQQLLQKCYQGIVDSGMAKQGAASDRRFDLLMAAVLYLNDYPGFRDLLLKECRKNKGLCPECGGTYKGLFSKKCSGCGRPMK